MLRSPQHEAANAARESAMNIYTGLLFLHGHIADARLFDSDAEFGRTYGNSVANDRALRERWERKGREDDLDEPAKDVPRAA
jgi:hypothetical protein